MGGDGRRQRRLSPPATRISVYVLVTVVEAAVLVASALVLVRLIDEALGARRVAAVLWLAGAAAGLLAAENALAPKRLAVAAVDGNRWVERLRSALFQRELRADLRSETAGSMLDAVDTVIRRVDRLRLLAVVTIPGAVHHGVMLLFVSGTMVALDVRLALVAFVLGALVFGAQTASMRVRPTAVRTDQSALASTWLDPATVRLARAHDRSSEIVRRFTRVSERVADAEAQLRRDADRAGAATAVALGLASVATYVAAVLLDVKASAGTLVTFAGLQWRLSYPLVELLTAVRLVRQELAEREPLTRLLRLPQQRLGGATPPPPPATVRLSGTGFTERGVTGLEIDIGPGERIALLGPSGSGKTTVLQLIAGLLGPYEGSIRIGGTEQRELSEAALRQLVAISEQPAIVIDGTVLANLCLDGGDWTAEDLARARRAAGLDIATTEVVGGSGRSLSSGERQRVSLARALLRPAPLLLLDEPTSHLDKAAADAVWEGLERTTRGRTVVIATHASPPAWLRRVELRGEGSSHGEQQ